MVLDDEPLRRRCFRIEGTTGQLEHPVAAVAVEMMMVSLAGALVERAHGGVIDLLEPPLVDQQLEVAVDCGLIERFHLGATKAENLLDSQGPILVEEDLFDGGSLGCLSLHRHGSRPSL